MKFISRSIPVFILLAVVLGCDAWVSIDGVVTDDESGTPVANAKIVIEQGNHKVGEYYSDEKGKFHAFDNIAPFPFSFTANLDCTVTKQGYETERLKINANERRTPDNPLRITVKKEP